VSKVFELQTQIALSWYGLSLVSHVTLRWHSFVANWVYISFVMCLIYTYYFVVGLDFSVVIAHALGITGMLVILSTAPLFLFMLESAAVT